MKKIITLLIVAILFSCETKTVEVNSQAGEGLLNNKYIFQPFWENTTDNSAPEWETSFQKSKEKVHKALKNHASSEILSILIDRLYILRNQLIHGASTWKGKLNREQVRDGERFMRHMVPCLIEIMISNPDEDWGRTFYPALN